MCACVPGSVTTTGGSDSSALASSTNCPRPPVRSVRWESACHRMHGRAYASPARRIGGQFGGCKLNLMRRRRVGFDAELVRLLDLPPQCGPPGWLTAMASWGRTRAMRESACTLSVPPTLSHTARGCLMDGRTDGRARTRQDARNTLCMFSLTVWTHHTENAWAIEARGT